MNKLISYLLVLFLFNSCKSPDQVEYELYLVNGEAIYLQHCANCHGQKGEGLRNLYPGLKGSEVIKSTPDLICLIRNGKKADSSQGGQAMPANSSLYELDMAQLSTFLNKNFGAGDTKGKVTVKNVKDALAKCQK